MNSALLQTIFEILEEAEKSNPDKPWEFSKLQPRGSKNSTLEIFKDLEFLNLISEHEASPLNEARWIKLEYQGEELLRLLRDTALQTRLDILMQKLAVPPTVAIVCKLAEEIMAKAEEDQD